MLRARPQRHADASFSSRQGELGLDLGLDSCYHPSLPELPPRTFCVHASVSGPVAESYSSGYCDDATVMGYERGRSPTLLVEMASCLYLVRSRLAQSPSAPAATTLGGAPRLTYLECSLSGVSRDVGQMRGHPRWDVCHELAGRHSARSPS